MQPTYHLTLRSILLLVFLTVHPIQSVHGQEFNFDSIAQKSYAEIHPFLFENFHKVPVIVDSDSVVYFQNVNKLADAAKRSNNQALLLESEFLKFLYLSSRNYPDYLSELLEFLKVVDDSKIEYLQARVRQAIGLYYFHYLNNYGKAFLYITESYPYFKNLTVKELPEKQELLYNIGYVYYNIGYAYKALNFLEEAEKLDNYYYPTLYCNIINTKGLIFKDRNEFQRAAQYFKQAIKAAKKNNHPQWERISMNNLAEVYITLNKYEEAQNLLNSPPFIKDENSEESCIMETNRLILLAKIWVIKEKWDELSAIVSKIKEFNQKFNFPLRIKTEIYPLLALDEKHKSNFEQAYMYSDTAMQLRVKYYELKSNEGLKLALEKERIDFMEDQNYQSKNQKKITWIITISLLIILALIVVISIILLKKQQGIYKKNREIVENKLSESKEKLEELLRDIKLKNKEVKAYEEEIQQLYSDIHKDVPRIHEREKTLEILLSKPIMTDSKWVVFKRAFDQVHPEYFKKLQGAIPGISPAEIRYMYLRKLKLTPHEITFVLGISQGSIRQYKHRIRAKINLDLKENLDDFLDSI